MNDGIKLIALYVASEWTCLSCGLQNKVESIIKEHECKNTPPAFKINIDIVRNNQRL